MKNETIIWEGKSSQLVNLGIYILGSIVSLFFLELHAEWFSFNNLIATAILSYLLWKFLEVQCDEYIVTDQRIIRKESVLNRRTYDIEIYRVMDVELSEPFFYRIFGLGNIRIISAQITKEKFHFKAVHFPQELRERIRGYARHSNTISLGPYF